MDRDTHLPDGYFAWCPVCKKKVERKEIMPVVCECFQKKDKIISIVARAFHFPNCSSTAEIELKEVSADSSQS